jgi:hypothetical protein
MAIRRGVRATQPNNGWPILGKLMARRPPEVAASAKLKLRAEFSG